MTNSNAMLRPLLGALLVSGGLLAGGGAHAACALNFDAVATGSSANSAGTGAAVDADARAGDGAATDSCAPSGGAMLMAISE